MGYTSIKVRSEDKADLDRLQHELALEGEDLSQHELVRRLLQFALRAKDDFFRAERASRKRKDWRKYQFDLPVATDASEVDRVVYGLDR